MTLSHWLDEEAQFGPESVFLHVGDDGQTGEFSASSLGTPILARPFFHLQGNSQDVELAAFPNVLRGQVDVRGVSEIYSGELLCRSNIGAAISSAKLGGSRQLWAINAPA